MKLATFIGKKKALEIWWVSCWNFNTISVSFKRFFFCMCHFSELDIVSVEIVCLRKYTYSLMNSLYFVCLLGLLSIRFLKTINYSYFKAWLKVFLIWHSPTEDSVNHTIIPTKISEPFKQFTNTLVNLSWQYMRDVFLHS